MNIQATSFKFFGVAGVIVLALLLAVANAPAHTNPAPAVAAAKSVPATTTLTPAVASSSPVPNAAAEDIRDIRQPRHLPTHWFWVVVAAGVPALGFAAWAFRRWLCQARSIAPSSHDIALRRLEAARRQMQPEHAREYCFAVSQIIRGYLENQLCLRAPRLTTEEFLRELVDGQDRIAGTQRALLVDFLRHCDLAKFAGWRYSLETLSALHETAVVFVRQTGAAVTAASPNGPAIATTAARRTLACPG